MAKTLVVVESPAKAKTIKKYLGSGYEVMASKGHIKDLPEEARHRHREGLPGDVRGRSRQGEGRRRSSRRRRKNVDEILLAPDPDREGEAIAWHLAEELKQRKKQHQARRVPRDHEEGRGVRRRPPARARQAPLRRAAGRRVLDRIVGYDVSALVWSKLAFGLSAGRVQSVALRLIVDRERGDRGVRPRGVLELRRGPHAAPTAASSAARPFLGAARRRATARSSPSRTARRPPSSARTSSDARYRIAKVTKSERKRNPPAPYTTSKLQQDAVNRLGFGAKRAMQIAQGLYEGIDLGKDGGPVGLITYMRTDSTRLSPDAVEAARDYIAEKLRQDVRPRAAQRLQVEEERAGRPRGHPSDVARAAARERAAAPQGRPVQALQARSGNASSPAR